MRHELEELMEVLDRLAETGRALLGASRRKCQALAAMKLKLIEKSAEQEKELTERVAELNARRRDLVVAITGEEPAAGLGDTAHNGSLTRLLEHLDEPERAKIAALRQELSDVMKEVHFANVTNGIVSRRSLKHFRELLGLLSGSGVSEQGYNRSGGMSMRYGPSSLVNHTV